MKSLSGALSNTGPGDIITVNPGEVHDGARIGGSGRAWQMIYLEPQTISDVFHEMTEARTAAFELRHPVKCLAVEPRVRAAIATREQAGRVDLNAATWIVTASSA